jgi:hypothetical protein
MQRSASCRLWYVTYALPEGPFFCAAALNAGTLRLTDTCTRSAERTRTLSSRSDTRCACCQRQRRQQHLAAMHLFDAPKLPKVVPVGQHLQPQGEGDGARHGWRMLCGTCCRTIAQPMRGAAQPTSTCSCISPAQWGAAVSLQPSARATRCTALHTPPAAATSSPPPCRCSAACQLRTPGCAAPRALAASNNTRNGAAHGGNQRMQGGPNRKLPAATAAGRTHVRHNGCRLHMPMDVMACRAAAYMWLLDCPLPRPTAAAAAALTCRGSAANHSPPIRAPAAARRQLRPSF